MDTIYLNIAGFIIRINFKKCELFYLKEKIKEEVKQSYLGFLVDKKPKKVEFTIDFVQEKLVDVFLRRRGKRMFISLYKEKKENKIEIFYHTSIFQFQTILREVIQGLLKKNNGFILHASANHYQGAAILFVGRSGVGKSTIMRLLNNKYPALADDSVIVKKNGNKFYCYATPFYEKESWLSKNSTRFPIKKIFFLRRKRFFKVKKIEDKHYLYKEIISHFLTTTKPSKKEISYIIEFLDNFNEFYFLSFTKDKIKELNCLICNNA